MTEIVITSAKRSPIGKFMGTLANLSAPDLGKIALDAVISDCKLERDVIDEVILGQVLTGGLVRIQQDKLLSLQVSQLKKVL